MQVISSRENELVKKVVRIAASPAARTQEGLFFADGIKLCTDLAQKQKPQVVFVTQKVLRENPVFETLGKETYLINDPVAAKLAATKTPQGVFALFELPRCGVDDIDTERGVLVCEAVQDPANVGAVVRSAAALGMGGVLLCGDCADAYGVKALRASAGAVYRIPVVRCELSEAAQSLNKKGVVIYAAALKNAVPLAEAEIAEKFAILVGNEGAGLTAEAINFAHKCVYVPMHSGMDSLNASVAASVLMYHFKAQKG